jgi:hypothetical protein
MPWLARLYARRIVNINVNVIAAGLLALLPLTLTVHLATTRLGLTHKIGISILSFFADLVFDVAIYFALHWLANHSPALKRAKHTRAADPSFFRDASLVQFERALLSPVLYIVAIGLQQVLLRSGWSAAQATALGFAAGIATSRILHTLWMLRSGRVY